MAKEFLELCKLFRWRLLFGAFFVGTCFVMAGKSYEFIRQLTPQTGSTLAQVWASAHQAGGWWLQFQLVWIAAVDVGVGLLLFFIVLLIVARPSVFTTKN